MKKYENNSNYEYNQDCYMCIGMNNYYLSRIYIFLRFVIILVQKNVTSHLINSKSFN